VKRTTSLLVLALAAAGCKAKPPATATVQTAQVTRQDIVVDVEATGVVTPINPLQVKSKASGTVLKIYV
jgi:multidrug efflux pump subunit AcrA (membrane-fusion protein)